MFQVLLTSEEEKPMDKNNPKIFPFCKIFQASLSTISSCEPANNRLSCDSELKTFNNIKLFCIGLDRFAVSVNNVTQQQKF